MQRALLAFMVALLLPVSVWAATVYTFASGAAATTVNEQGLCRHVSNPGTGTRWISTNTLAEWQSFVNNPNGLTMAACTLQTNTYTSSYTGGYNDSTATNAFCIGKGYQGMQTYTHSTHVQQQCYNGGGDTGPVCSDVTYYDTKVTCYRYV